MHLRFSRANEHTSQRANILIVFEVCVCDSIACEEIVNAKQLRLKLVHAGTATVFQNWPAVKTPLNRVGISKHAKDFMS